MGGELPIPTTRDQKSSERDERSLLTIWMGPFKKDSRRKKKKKTSPDAGQAKEGMPEGREAKKKREAASPARGRYPMRGKKGEKGGEGGTFFDLLKSRKKESNAREKKPVGNTSAKYRLKRKTSKKSAAETAKGGGKV